MTRSSNGGQVRWTNNPGVRSGAYIRETRLSLVGHLEQLQRYPALKVAKGRPRARTDTVATTWQISLEWVQPTPGAVTLLRVGRRHRRPSLDPLPPCRLVSANRSLGRQGTAATTGGRPPCGGREG
jgi:hypothetical protein